MERHRTVGKSNETNENVKYKNLSQKLIGKLDQIPVITETNGAVGRKGNGKYDENFFYTGAAKAFY